MSRLAFTALALVALLSPASAFAAAAKPTPTPTPTRTARAVFAMGCFWSAEAAFEKQPGVIASVSGYAGGKEQNPTYDQVSSHGTGHLEAVEVTYDPTKTTYARLLDQFWHSIDPTQTDGQFCDIGPQYATAIFPVNDEQRREALASRLAIEASKRLKRPIATRILPTAAFWPAEDYHQDFFRKNPIRYKSHWIGCGGAARIVELWGKDAGKSLVD